MLPISEINPPIIARFKNITSNIKCFFSVWQFKVSVPYKLRFFVLCDDPINGKLFYLRSINPMIEKINPTIPIPITSSPIPDEQREIIMAKSSIAIPNPIFFIVNPPLQMSICCHLHYTSLAIEKIAYFMKLVGWEQLAAQGLPRWQVHKRVAGGSQRRGSVASPVWFGADQDCGKSQPSGEEPSENAMHQLLGGV